MSLHTGEACGGAGVWAVIRFSLRRWLFVKEGSFTVLELFVFQVSRVCDDEECFFYVNVVPTA